MMAQCDICTQVFDTKFGGDVCTKCRRAFCPHCAEGKIVNNSDEPICTTCAGPEGDDAMVGV